jgi:NADH-quinone oxidoreductase subunit D
MTFVIPVGPQHPALLEPEHFRFEVKGEEIVNVGIRLGYMHRGIERALSERTYHQGLYLAERICGICSHSHNLCFAQAVERLAKVEVPDRAEYIRTIVAELERIHSHLLWAGVAAHEIGFITLFMLFWRDREHVQDLLELTTGNRCYYSMCALGGVRRDIKPEHLPKLKRGLDVLEKATNHYVDVATSDRTILARCENVGVLTKQIARDLCAVGPTARASGVNRDMRRDDPYAAYPEISFKVAVQPEGDVLARVVVRLQEVLEAINIIRQALKKMPAGPIRTKWKPEIPPNQATARIEAPRGELLHFGISNGTNKPERWRARTPTYANFASLGPMFVGESIAEIPIVLASIDPCMCCTDRVTTVDVATGKSRVLTMEKLRRMSK